MEKYCPKCFARYAKEVERCEADGTYLCQLGEQDLSGQVIDGRYTVLQKIGQGGMGVVYKAEQHLVKRVVALKVLRRDLAEDEGAVRRFMTEAQAIGALRSRHTVTLHDVGVTREGLLYYTMELLNGRALSQVIAEEAPLEPVRAVRLMAQVCESLEEAHGLGVLHRDLKPENLFVEQERGRESIKVLDFGIAKLMGEAGKDSVTRTGMIVGTPQYLSPEQAMGTASVPASDLYSLATVMYEMLSGLPPFQADTPIQTVWAHIKEPMPDLNGRNPYVQVPEGLQRFLRRALEKDPKRRFATAAEFRESLMGALGDYASVSETMMVPPVQPGAAPADAMRERAREHARMFTPWGPKVPVTPEEPVDSTVLMEAVPVVEPPKATLRGSPTPIHVVEKGTYCSVVPQGDEPSARNLPTVAVNPPPSVPTGNRRGSELAGGVAAPKLPLTAAPKKVPMESEQTDVEIGSETMEMIAAQRRSSRTGWIWIGLAVLGLLVGVMVWRPWAGTESGKKVAAGVNAEAGVVGAGLNSGKDASKLADVVSPDSSGGTDEIRTSGESSGSGAMGGAGAVGHDVVPGGAAAAQDVVSDGQIAVPVHVLEAHPAVDHPVGHEGPSGVGEPDLKGAPVPVPAVELRIQPGGADLSGDDQGNGVWQSRIEEAKKAMDRGNYDEAMYLLAKARKDGAPEFELKTWRQDFYRRARKAKDAEDDAARLKFEAEQARLAAIAKGAAELKAAEDAKAALERARLKREAEEQARKEKEASGREALKKGLEARQQKRWKECVQQLEKAAGAGAVDASALQQLKYCREQSVYEQGAQ